MADPVAVSAPESDTCALCGSTRDAHGTARVQGTGHHFVVKAQLASERPRPADPLRDIRVMTEEDKRRAVEVERTFAGSRASLPREVKEERAMKKFDGNKDESKPRPNDKRPCEVCGRPRSNHRGAIDHHYQPMSRAAIAAREEKPAPLVSTNELKPVVTQSRRSAAKRQPKSRRSAARQNKSATERPTFLQLAGEIDALRSQLEEKVAMMREMLA